MRRQRQEQERKRVRGPLRVLILILVLLASGGAGCTKGVPADVAARLRPVTLAWWGVNETSEEVRPLIEEYQKVHPNVQIAYRKLRFEEYERALLEAIAEGDFRGPDIFAVPSSWTRRFHSKLLPAPPIVTMPYQETRGTVKKEIVAELRPTRTPHPDTLAATFLDTVVPDAVLRTEDGSRDAVFGLPLSADTLVLYANRDLLNAAGIPEPARTWAELQQHAPRLTVVGADGSVRQAGAALGGSANVQRAADILALLMMQNGAVMAGPNGAPTFHQIPEALSGQRQTPPGIDALQFYASFATPGAQSRAWDDAMPDSLAAFLEGRVAYLLGYSYHLPIIRARAPRINLSVTGAPHVAASLDPATGTVVGSDVAVGAAGAGGAAVNYADIWLQVVSERTKYADETWDFLTFATTRPAVVEQYLATARRPTALRSLIGGQLEDPQMRVFAAQLLTARNWYRGKNIVAAEAALLQLIEDAKRGTVPIVRAMQIAAEKIGQTL